jgi:drug/metabolite transporter (DMT)-like permease
MSPDLKNPTAPKPSAWRLIACLLAVYIVWGTTYFAIKVAIEGIAPFFLVGTRFLVAGVMCIAQ